MADSDKSQGIDLDTAMTQVAGLLDQLVPEFSDDPEGEKRSDAPSRARADKSVADPDDSNDYENNDEDVDSDDPENNEDQDTDGADGDDDDDEADDGDTESSPWNLKRKIKVDGEEIEVTPEEALAGFQRQSATTRRFMEVAELKKKLNQQLESTQTEQQKYVQALQVLEQAFTGALNEPNWDELRKNPSEYDRERAAFLERKEQLRQLQDARKNAETQAQATAKQARDSKMDEQRELLMTAIPEWIDADVATKESQQLVKYAMNKYGYSTEDFGGIDDHRVYVILRKAMLYDGAKDKPGKAAAKGGKPSPSLKPGGKPPQGKQAKGAKAQQKALSKAKKSGSMEDALEAVLHMID